MTRRTAGDSPLYGPTQYDAWQRSLTSDALVVYHAREARRDARAFRTSGRHTALDIKAAEGTARVYRAELTYRREAR